MKILLAILAVLSQSLAAQGADIEIKDPWIRAVPPSSTATAGFFVILNKSATPISLVGAEAAISKDIRPMVTTKKSADGKDVMGMEFVERLTVEAGKSLALVPGGDHLMFMKLAEVPASGAVVPVTLIFETPNGRQSIAISASVR